MVVHNFQGSLKKSEEWSKWPGWERVYRNAFPSFQSMNAIVPDGWAQRGGIDRDILLSSGKHIRIEEKVRHEDYDDIFLEFYSDTQRKTPGWIEKDLACDYLSYLIVPVRLCYIFPFLQLRLAWLRHKEKWKRNYPVKPAPNGNYVTTGVCVPPYVILNALYETMIFSD